MCEEPVYLAGDRASISGLDWSLTAATIPWPHAPAHDWKSAVVPRNINHVTQALKPIPGVVDVSADLPSGHVRVSGSLDSGPERLVSALNDAGYPAKVSAATAYGSTSATPSGQAKAGRGGCCCG